MDMSNEGGTKSTNRQFYHRFIPFNSVVLIGSMSSCCVERGKEEDQIPSDTTCPTSR